MAYDFDTLPERRGTSSLKWDYEERLAGTSGLLPLWVADMDFAAPPEIVDAVRRRVDHGVFGYTLEPESWFEAAAAWLGRRHAWEVRREWMLASPGVMPGLAASILGLTGPGDSVIVQPPVYYPFALRIRANGRQVVENPLQLSGDRWEMDLDGLETAGGQGARMLVLCSPHNPVSRVWETKVLLRLAEICARRKIVIVSDEIHADIVMPGFHHVPLASVSAQAAASSVTLLSATKSFNLAGLGGSLTVIPDPGLRAKVDAVQHALFAGVANAPAVAASEAAWRLGDRWLDEMLSYVEGNHRFLMHFLAARLPAVKVFPLEGTYLALLDLRALGLSDEQATEKLRNDAKVWLDEGRKFGRAGEGMQRLNLACPRGLLMDALERMAKALAPGG